MAHDDRDPSALPGRIAETIAGSAFEIIPGIDLRGGKCVRLLHGDFAQETIFDDDPAAAARRWQEQGATRLHVVDLEGSRDGVHRNLSAIKAILDAVEIPVQVAGGIRDQTGALRLLSLGAGRVVIGTAAVKNALRGSTRSARRPPSTLPRQMPPSMIPMTLVQTTSEAPT